MNETFPANPTPGMLFEIRPGLVYIFDAGVRTWVKTVSSNTPTMLVTNSQPGAMSHLDLRKLNRLLIPPPQSSIIGNDCVGPFKRGTISLYGDGQFVTVEGSLDVRNNTPSGAISRQIPFHIHQHTFGFDFKLDLDALFAELIKRGQFNVIGKQGDKGPKGPIGDPGEDNIPTGPKGHKGPQGAAPRCATTLTREVIPAEPVPGLLRAITSIEKVIDPTDASLYSLVATRQAIGSPTSATSKLNVKQVTSPWLLAIPFNTGIAQQVYYIDADPILDTIHQKFLAEVKRLKQGYEAVVAYWVQTMSDLFDEQKAALCCALEFCMSKTKSTQLRQHMELVAASAAGTARMRLHGRGDKQEAVNLSSTRTLPTDLCKNGPPFPQPPGVITEPFPPPPPPVGAQVTAPLEQQAPRETIQAEKRPDYETMLAVDPTVHAGIARNGATIMLGPGSYVVTIKECTSNIEGRYRGDLRIQHIQNGKRKVSRFLDKGSFQDQADAKAAYEGLSTAIKHDGGNISLYYPVMPTPVASGYTIVEFRASDVVMPQTSNMPQVMPTPAPAVGTPIGCVMAATHLAWYEQAWNTGNCCGAVVKVGGQDYIVVKRSLGSDAACGGGETLATPCLAAFVPSLGHPAFAWPTLDGKTFAPLPSGSVTYVYDEVLNKLAVSSIADGQFRTGKGNPAGVRHLSHQLSIILFPAA